MLTGDRNIYLTGPMGAGKTTVARRLAAALARGCVELDEAIESRAGMPISGIFASLGEAAFRDLEAGLLREVGRRTGLVVAVGGGCPLRRENRDLMRETGVRVYLKIGARDALKRLGPGGDRPLLGTLEGDALRQRWGSLLQERREVYEEAEITVDASLTAEEVARSILAALDAAPAASGSLPGVRIEVALGSRAYPVFLGDGLLARAGGILRELKPGRTLAVVADRRAFEFHGRTLMDSLEGAGWRVHRFEVEPGEGSKRMVEMERLAEGFMASGLDRHDAVVAFGGGVAGDLAGFAASTYMRGIPFVQVPTTLLAQVDASVGGKTAVNLREARNAVGTFHQPRAVIADPAVLKTLPARELRSGLAEAAKMGILGDAALFGRIDAELDGILSLAPAALLPVVEGSVRGKAAVVARDERESDLRMALNLGHTLGHALEEATGFAVYLHGEAVAFGCVAAAALAEEEGLCGPETVERVAALFCRFVALPGLDAVATPALLDALRRDKKKEGETVRFVLPTAIGRVVIRDNLSPERIRNAIERARRFFA